MRRRTLLCTTAVAAMAGCAAPGQPPQPIRVISFGGGFNLPLWAARDRGFFARHGLVPTLTVTADSRQLFAGLMDGSYDVAITAFANIVAYQEGQGEATFDP